MRRRALALAAIVLAAGVSGLTASSAAAGPPLGADALVRASTKNRVRVITTPRLYTKTRHTMLLAFVVAGGGSAGERVSRISGDGLRWSPVVRSDGRGGATEIWRARARRWLSGRIVVTLASGASPAIVTVVAYGASSYVARRIASRGRGSVPRISLSPVAGSLLWTVGLSEGQRGLRPLSGGSASRRALVRTLVRQHRTGAWVDLTTVRSARTASAAGGVTRARAWNIAAVDVVVPGLKRLIEEGAIGGAPGAGAAALPRYCPPLPAFEVGVQDDPVFLGLQPAMTPARGFELAGNVFHARLLRLNLSWGEVKLYGWGPYDRAVAMARERCWAIHMTIMPTPVYAEGHLNSELSGRHLNLALFASFAGEIARRYAGKIARFGIGNEPDEGKFIVQTGSVPTDTATYDRLYMTGYDAVRAADPGVAVIAGEIGSKHIYEWLSNVAALPSSGVSIHPYGLTRILGELVKYVAPVPLLVTEDGVSASDPAQLADDLEREEIARRAGVKEFVFYQLSRADATNHFWWNTGIE